MDDINVIHELMSGVMALATITITSMSFIICLPRKFPIPVIIAAFVLLSAGLLLINQVTGHINNLPVPNGWPYIPLIIFMFKGHVFQKLFLLFANFFISFSIIIFFSMTFGFFVKYGSFQIFLMMTIAVFITFTIYIILMLKFGKQLLKRLFDSGSKKEWGLHMMNIFIIYYVQYILQRVHVENSVFYFGMQLFMIWSFIILCYSIINTHEKAKRKYEAENARDIITTGRDYYQKINEQYDALRIMKHDYKFHLNAALDMLRRGETEKSDAYLNGLKNQLEENELFVFCDNPVINSLVSDYAEKCKGLDIDFNAAFNIPENFNLSNYEMCIVLGNLLENAVEACQKLTANRQIKLIVKPQGEQLAVMVRNTYDGIVVKDGEKFISTKKNNEDRDYGLGLQSVMAVVDSYGEMFHIEYDSEWFNVFALWKSAKK